MPMWDRHCNVCDEIFTVSCRHELKEEPKECPYCGSTDGTYMLAAPSMTIRGDRLMTHKKDAGFGEVIDKIKERNKRTPLATGRQPIPGSTMD